MADFGKLDFNTSFVPTSAFPLDGRTYFWSLADAQAAAASAGEVGSKDSKYFYGQKLLVTENSVETWYIITRDKTLQKEGAAFETDATLVMENGVLKVNMATEVGDQTLPVTAAAVNTTVGNIETLLATI